MRQFLVWANWIIPLAACLTLIGCEQPKRSPQSTATAPEDSTVVKEPQMLEEPFGTMPDGQKVTLFTCTNAHGLVMKVTDYGARLVALEVPDKKKKLANVTLGFDSLEGYLKHTAFFGCTTGRYANRIAEGKFTLEGKEYKLATNNGPNHLHGGLKGFDKKVWQGVPVTPISLKPNEPNSQGVEFTYRSIDGEEGYPGNLDVTVTYLLTDSNELQIKYKAESDKATVINLTNHAYWNLAGAGAPDMLDHELTLMADKFLPVDEGAIPLGPPAEVKGTVMDFTTPHTIGERIAQVKNEDAPTGYDHCYVLRSANGSLALAARVKHPTSGRVMEVLTTEPAIQLYTSLYLNGNEANGGHKQYAAFCLETQHYPDSPNRPEYPTTVLKPGETYQQTTVYKFTVE